MDTIITLKIILGVVISLILWSFIVWSIEVIKDRKSKKTKPNIARDLNHSDLTVELEQLVSDITYLRDTAIYRCWIIQKSGKKIEIKNKRHLSHIVKDGMLIIQYDGGRFETLFSQVKDYHVIAQYNA